MAARNISAEMDTVDSSSESGVAESVVEDEQVQQTEVHSLVNNGVNEMDTQSDGSLHNSESANLVHDIDVDEDFKTEWTDTIHIPLACLQSVSRVHIRGRGDTHRWKGIDWSNLFIFNQVQFQFGAFIGYDEQPFKLATESFKVKYQYYLLDDQDEIAIEGNGCEYTFGGQRHEGREDNGFHALFPYDKFMNYLRAIYQSMLSEGEAPSLQDIEAVRDYSLPVRLKVMMEEPYMSRFIPADYDSKKSTGLVGLENLGATCYLNALLQMLYHVNSFRCAVYKLPHEGENLSTSTTLALQTVFRNLQISQHEVTTKELTVAFGWTSAEAFLQQDVQEMMRVLIDKLEDKMKGTVVEGVTKDLFAGQVRSYIKCVNVQYESKRNEDFYDIQLDVKGCKNIYQSFKKYIEVEMLDGENQYEAGEHGKQDAQKGVIFENFPPVLTVHLKRFDFDLQTMNFTKIHDHYEFPLRLELDAYLAEDCPEESRRVPNNYVLHSVLVHQGDVGGGHYYAYIRPTTETFNYATLLADPAALTNQSLAHRDQQWYKFNDEVVSQVPQREAVDVCYGRRIKETSAFRGLSSAYMLVYIREAEAPTIMRPVVPSDIPTDLEDRLQTELNAKLAAEKRFQRQHDTICIQYTTEKEVAAFTDYSRFNDWLSDRSLKELPMLRDTLKLGVLLAISDALKKSPAEIRLWEIEKHKFTFQLSDDIDADELQHRMKMCRFYVEDVPFAGSQEDLDSFHETYYAIRHKETSLLDELRIELSRHDDLFYAENEDPVYCCGIGSSNLPVLELKHYSIETFNKFNNAFQELRSLLLELLQTHYPNCPEEHMLVFVKLYDPYDLLPQLGAEPDDSLGGAASEDEEEDLSDEEDLDEADSGGSGNGSGSTGNGNGTDGSLKRRRVQTKAPLPQYLPMKYAGSQLISRAEPVSSLAALIQHFIKVQHPEVSDDWQSECQRFRYYTGESPASMRALSTREVEHKLSFGQATQDEHEWVFYVDIIPQHSRPLLVPFNITDTKNWMLFQAFKKTIGVRPFQARDAALLQRRQAERAAQLLHRSNGDGDDNSKLLSPGALLSQSPGSHTMGNPLRKRQKSFLRDRSSSISSQHSLRDRAGSTGSELGLVMSPNRVPLASNRRSVSGKPYTMLVPLMARVSDVICRVADELEVDPSHVALFFVQRIAGNKSWLKRRFDAFPLSLANCTNSTVKDTLEKQKVTLKVNAKYCVFYRINPYPAQVDLLRDFRTCDFVIVDERIRYWRRLFLEHLRLSPPAVKKTIDLTQDRSPVASQPSNPSTPTRRATTAMEVVDLDADLVTATTATTNGGGASESVARRTRSGSETQASTSQISQASGTGSQGSQRAASIVWPEPPGAYDGHEEAVITYRVGVHVLFRQISDSLRDLAGIPKNFAELEALKLPVSDAETATPSAAQQMLLLPDTRKALCLSIHGTCSDYLRVSETGTFTPAFPLLVTCIRNGCVDEILYGSVPASKVMDSLSELNNSPCQLFYNGLQYVSPEDALLMYGAHPSVRSIPLSVFSYVLVDHKIVVVEVNATKPTHLPFASYVRDDDDFNSLARRLAAHTGEKDDWQALLLAVLDNNTDYPAYVPRASPVRSTPTTSPVLTGRKSSLSDSQVDSQATEIDPENNSQSVEAPVVPSVAAQPSPFGQVFSALSKTAQSWMGPSAAPEMGLSLSSTHNNSNTGPASPNSVPRNTALWKFFSSRYGGLHSRREIAENSALHHKKPHLVRLGIQRGVSSTAPRVGLKRNGGGSIKII